MHSVDDTAACSPTVVFTEAVFAMSASAIPHEKTAASAIEGGSLANLSHSVKLNSAHLRGFFSAGLTHAILKAATPQTDKPGAQLRVDLVSRRPSGVLI
ncbi:hypothetical protein [Neorhodopirellula pilleata]|uniref:hypothetical protein n=1 Tax=Neorhodopirellula pilleata TaxID=2714738 RepID=UPI0018CEAFA2|nr:hypothetical protein [Neorhodopirellula pilleata]